MSTDSPGNWYKIAESIAEINFPSTSLTEIEVNGKTICLIKHNETIFACTQKCPHAGGLMANGHLDAIGNLVCPLHRYHFDPKTGRNTSGEGYFLKTFLVQERVDGIYVCIKQASIF